MIGCSSCSKQFRRINVTKALFKGEKYIICTNCKSKFIISYISRLLTSILLVTPFFIASSLLHRFGNYTILILLVLELISIVLLPMILVLRNDINK